MILPLDKVGRALEVLGRVADLADKADDVLDRIVEVEREDDIGRVDRVTLLGFIPLYNRARRAEVRKRRAERRRERQQRRYERRDAP